MVGKMKEGGKGLTLIELLVLRSAVGFYYSEASCEKVKKTFLYPANL